ncbi:phage holin family protein [Mesobacillus maritimus]|uniref:phage holin family protein n=1 Tax=Mesobacillus maritimus TaxID=1643336 RepID=UPI00384FF402
MDLLLEFLNQNYYMMVPALWVIGYGLKHTPRIPDWTIIWILLVISISFGSFAFGFSTEGILNGVIAAGVSVLGHQMFKQTMGSKRNKKLKVEKRVENNGDKKKESI